MEALALYLWHLLSSREESDPEEEEVELPHIKLPEVTVLRKRGDPGVPLGPGGTSGKRKRVSFAEPLNDNRSNMTITNKLKPPGSLADHYTLVPVHTDHDYVSAPLVCYRQLPGGVLVKTPVVVSSVDQWRRITPNEDPETASPPATRKRIINEIPPLNSRRPMKDSNFTTPFEKEDATFERDKIYKPVQGWSELLEQFGAKPEDGDILFDKLIDALSGEDKENIGSDESDDDEECEETCENGNDHDDDSDSVEIIWEGPTSQPKAKAKDNPVLRRRLSDEEPSKTVFRKLFAKVVEQDVVPAEVTSEDISEQSGNVWGHLKESVVQPVDGSGRLPKDEAPLSSVSSSEEKEDPDRCAEQPAKTHEKLDSSGEPSNFFAASIERRDQLNAESRLQPDDTIEVSGCSAFASGAHVQNVATIEPELDFIALCDRALSVCDPQCSTQTRKKKRSKTKTETTEGETTGDKSKIKKRRPIPKPARIKPIEELSKKQIISRLAKEIRSSQDPRDMMDEDLFKTTFGVSKEFANFLIKSLAPHLAPSEKTRISRTPEYLKVLTALQFFTSGNGNREIGRVIHLSQPSVSRALSEVISVLISTAPDPELPILDSEFNELYGLPHIIGAVDSTHVPIRPPSGIGRNCKAKERFENPTLYKNSANYYSINVEIVSSSSNKVLFCHTKLPGICTKSLLWRKSEVRKLMTERHIESNASCKLIAGSGYNCEPWLLTPCRAGYSNSPESRYNAALATALQDSVRLTIGLLKGRFKCLGMASSQQALNYSLDKAAQVVTACCVLHNLLMDFGEEMPQLAFDEFDLVETSDDSNETNWDGLEARNSYILENFC